ncbi:MULTISPECIES: TIGR04149 family rSAM-modified RiPP [Bacteroidales]|uniref:TIGR04149 family rSAM-modified RiPP n=1 Tax=Bacteroidales TaxID=171549 RepID=UPI0025AEAA2C|nr:MULTISPECIES: TIGR04149 family rSAM-modified RiPP [Bacteroidales]
MKPIKKISLQSLANSELDRAKESFLKGGIDLPPVTICGTKCPCKYAGPQEGPDDDFFGGSSTADKSAANGRPLVNN